MNKILGGLDYRDGVNLTDAVFIISTVLLFNPPIGSVLWMVVTVLTVSFIVFAISAFVFRQRFTDAAGIKKLNHIVKHGVFFNYISP